MASQIPSLVPLKTSTSRNLSSPSSDLLDTTSPKPEPVPPAPPKTANKSPQYLLDEGSYSHLHLVDISAKTKPTNLQSLKHLVDLSAITQLRDFQKSFTHNREEEPHQAPWNNLLESQHDFDTGTKDLETEAAISQKQIKDRLKAAHLQTKNTQYSRNVEIDKELHQKQYTAAQTQELSRTREGGREGRAGGFYNS